MEKIKIARIALASKHPYFEPGLWALGLIMTEEVPTMAVDAGWRLYVNPTWTGALEAREVVGVLWHELEHLLRRHFDRREAMGADPWVWNLATDCAINDGAQEAGLTLPTGGLQPEQFGLQPGLHEEEYYRLLERKGVAQPEAGQGQTLMPGQTHTHAKERPWELPPDDTEHPSVSPALGDALRREVARRILEQARSRGNVPAGMVRWAEGEYNPTIPWQRVLAYYVRQGVRRTTGRSRATYERLHRRHPVFAEAGVWLPGSYAVKPAVAAVVDTSGSVSDQMLGQVLGELKGLLRTLSGDVVVYATDAATSGPQKVRRVEQVKLLGGGGTDMRVGIAAAMKARPRPDLVVVLTDGLTPWPESPPPVPVVVGIIQGEDVSVPPWAKRVDIK